jgi:hypothetical protein
MRVFATLPPSIRQTTPVVCSCDDDAPPPYCRRQVPDFNRTDALMVAVVQNVAADGISRGYRWPSADTPSPCLSGGAVCSPLVLPGAVHFANETANNSISEATSARRLLLARGRFDKSAVVNDAKIGRWFF